MPRLTDLQHRAGSDSSRFGLAAYDPTTDSFADTGSSDNYAELRMADSFADTGDSFMDSDDSFALTGDSERDLLELETTDKVPQLLPKRLAPKEFYAPVVSLKKVERIEINSFKVISGVVFYVLDVFLVHATSRIPTVALQQVQSIKRRQQRRAGRPSRGSARAAASRPDYRVLRRFSDFDKMRRHVGRFARFQVLGSCPYCDALRVFLATCYGKPVPMVKLFMQKPEARIKMLERFVNRMVQLSVGRVSETFNSRLTHQAMCAGFNAVPTLVDQFLRPVWLS